MWISRTSRGRRDLPVSLSEVEGICAGCVAGAVVVMELGLEGPVVVVVGGAPPAAWLMVEDSTGGEAAWGAVCWVLFGDAILKGLV